MKVLGVDPGLREVGWCIVPNDAKGGAQPAELAGNLRARTRSAWLDQLGGTMLWQAQTLRRRQMDAPTFMAEVVTTVVAKATENRVDLVALETFVHRPWEGRAIAAGPDMVRLVERLRMNLEANDVDVIEVRASDSKRGQELAKEWHRNSHEFSAWCAAMYGAGVHRREQQETEREEQDVAEGIDSVTVKTDEQEVTVDPDAFFQGELLEVDRELPVEWVIAVQGASGLECTDEVQIGEDVTAELTGEVVEVRVKERTYPQDDESGLGGQPYLERKAVIKADGAKLSKLVHRPVV